MNEREFFEFVNYLESKKELSNTYDLKAKYNQNFLIQKMFDILGIIDHFNYPMSRLSIHTINFHMVCFDRTIWRTGKYSIARSILVSLQVAGGYTAANFERIADDISLLDFSFPDAIEIITTFGKITRTKEELIEHPLFSFHYGRMP